MPSDIDRAFSEMLYGGTLPEPSGIILMHPTVLAVYEATRLNQGRNWRRVKREVRKSFDKARKSSRGIGISKAPANFWRNAAK